jgi:hypothetical protein
MDFPNYELKVSRINGGALAGRFGLTLRVWVTTYFGRDFDSGYAFATEADAIRSGPFIARQIHELL